MMDKGFKCFRKCFWFEQQCPFFEYAPKSFYLERLVEAMRKTTSLVLVIVLLLSLSAQALASDVTHAGDNVQVARIQGVGADSSKLKTNSIDNGANIDPSADVSYSISENGAFIFSGDVNNIPFSVHATPYATPANKNVQVFNGVDQLDHYQVLYVAVEKEIADSVKYFDTVNCSSYSYMVKLYMRTNHTDDIVIVEIFTNYDYYSIATRQTATVASENTYDEDEGKVNQFWYAKVFTPVETCETGTTSRQQEPEENEATYTYVFNHLGATYYQYFTLWRYVRYPESFENSGQFQTTLKVQEAYTEVPGYPNENSDTTFMRIDSAQIDIVLDEGYAVDIISFDGLTHRNRNASVSLKFDDTIPLWGPLSLQFNYDNSDDFYDLNTTEQHLTNGGDIWYRQVGAELESGHRLEEEGHYFSATWDVGNYVGAKTNQEFQVCFSYTMTNTMAYDHWTNGDKQFSCSVYFDTD